jgi:poly(hydroxyalkanoate) depolymerase family esterase
MTSNQLLAAILSTAAAAALGACAGSASSDPAAAPVPAAAADTARVIVAKYESGHGARSYRLYVPAGRHSAARPLVVMLHGCAQTAAELATAGRLDSLGAELGALMLLPEQPAGANPLRCWNWFVPAHQARDAGEPAIIAGLTRQIAREHGADEQRIVIGGLSAGGAMAVLTGLAYPDLYAAVGTHSGVGWRVAGDVPGAFAAMRGGGVDAEAQARDAHAAMGSRARVVPVIAIHGAADTVAHPRATDGLMAQLVALHRLVAPGAELRADTSRMEAGGYPVEVRRYTAGGRVVLEHQLVTGLAHALSGGDTAARWTDARGPDGAREMLRFMLSHRHE